VTIPKTVLLLIVGYYFGRAYVQIGKYFDYAAFGTILLLVGVVTIYLIIRFTMRRLALRNKLI